MCEEDNIANRTRQFASDFLSYQTAYYTHRGTLSHACLVLQMAIFAWIMTKDMWVLFKHMNLFLFIFFIIFWFIPYLYVRWELRKRRFSAIRIAAIAKALGEWVTNDPVAEESKSQEKNQSRKLKYSRLRLIDYIFPLPLFLWFFPADYMMNCMANKYKTGKYTAPWSQAIQDAVKERNTERSIEFYFEEYLVSITSFLIWIIVPCRRLMDC